MQFGFRNVSGQSTRRPTLGVATYRRSLYEMRWICQISGTLERIRSLGRQLERRSAVEAYQTAVNRVRRVLPVYGGDQRNTESPAVRTAQEGSERLKEPAPSWRNGFVCSEQAKTFGVAEGSNVFCSPGICCGKQGGVHLLRLHPIIIVRLDP